MGWVGGWFEIWRVKLISTQVVVEVEVGVELGNWGLGMGWSDQEIILALLGSQDFDPQRTAKRDRVFSALTPLMIRFYCIVKLQFPKHEKKYIFYVKSMKTNI